ncbi:FAD-dependent oxidoreductase [Paraburkholderia caffeinilytica]|uniref:FAD-dependent oxidoreductase n=1 Tax=Paraburkholderia caffeinilytica TaxID=1761016 RepID=UPI0038BD3958
MQRAHISIIGAGLGGLCLAQGLKRAGIDFDVYERDPAATSRGQGYRIRIDADGQQPLSQCLPAGLYALFRQSCGAARSVQFLNGNLEQTAGRPARSWQASAVESGPQPKAHDLSANRQTLREILLSGIEERVHFAKAFRRFELIGEGEVRVRFDGGEARTSTLLVGADGVNSLVREQLAPAAEPVDTGAVCIYGKTTATTALRDSVGAALCSGTSVIFADGFAMILDPMLFPEPLPSLAARLAPACRLNPVDDYLYWAFIGPRARLGVSAAALPDQSRLTALIDTIVHRWHPRLRTLFAEADAATLTIVPVRSASPAIATWRAGPVTLLGDAIHAMSPAGGVGANSALRDAAALAGAAANGPDLRQAVARYEIAMRAWAEAAIRASEAGARRLFGATSGISPPVFVSQ